jgi:putative FmdB family regulatory protein
MPLYEYQCDACGSRFERIQRFSDPPPSACPSCKGPVRKLLSSPAIRFKGSGWYVTDYARKGAAASSDNGAAAAKDASKDTDGKAATASDKKTASGKADSSSGSSSTPTG